VKFVNAKPVYFPPMTGNAKWASDNGSSASYRTAAYKDKDGSLGYGPNAYVVIHGADGVNDSIAVDTDACEIKPTWNAAVCKGDVGRMNIGGDAGGGRGGAPGVAVLRRCWSRSWWPRRRWPWRRRRSARRGSWRQQLGSPRTGCWRRSSSRWRRTWSCSRCGRSARRGSWRSWRWRRCCCSPCSATHRSQPQWQGIHRNLGQRTSRYRDQGGHRKAEREPLRDGTG
jgi:hypothetical protein